MIWEETDEQVERVVEASEWIPFSSCKTQLEERSGVYIFADNDFDVKYIGKAGAGRMVVENKTNQEEQEVGKFFFEVYSAIKKKKIQEQQK